MALVVLAGATFWVTAFWAMPRYHLVPHRRAMKALGVIELSSAVALFAFWAVGYDRLRVVAAVACLVSMWSTVGLTVQAVLKGQRAPSGRA
jgi:hypothetical protein